MRCAVNHVKSTFRHPVVRGGWIALAVAISIFIITVLFFWYPSASKFHAVEQDIDKLQNKITVFNKLKELSSTYYVAENALDRIEKKLDTSTSLAEFTNALYKLASKNNIQIISKTSHDVQIKNNYKILNQELTLHGSYKSMRQFILSLRDLPTWTLIKEVRMKKKTGSNLLVGDFVITSYQENTSS